MTLYHYTNAVKLEAIKKKGLCNFFGLIFFTTSEEVERTVMSSDARISIVKKNRKIRKFSIDRQRKYEIFNSFMSLDFIDFFSDTTKWYYTHLKKISPKDIVKYEILVKGVWFEV